MPNRIIRESCRTSETLEQLSGDGERLFWRLVTVADDFGRFEADPRVIRSACFPLRDTLKTATVERWFAELTAAELAVPYMADGKRYAFFSTWDRHQTRRARNPKFPDPPADASTCEQTQANVSEERGIEERGIEESRKRLSPVERWFLEEFVPAYPAHRQQTQLKSATSFVVRTLRPDEETRARIMLNLAAWKASEDWAKDDGKYIPGLRVFFDNHCHERSPQRANGGHARPYTPC